MEATVTKKTVALPLVFSEESMNDSLLQLKRVYDSKLSYYRGLTAKVQFLVDNCQELISRYQKCCSELESIKTKLGIRSK